MLAAALVVGALAFTAPPRPAHAPLRRRVGGSAVVMAGMPLPTGSLVALVTPMTETGEVDIPTLRKLLRWHKEEGTNGIVILGTTGEASTLTTEERCEVMAATRDEIGGELPIVVGTGTVSTQATIAATKQAKLFGADAALVVTPYYVKPSQSGLLQHFTQIADAYALLPIVLHVPHPHPHPRPRPHPHPGAICRSCSTTCLAARASTCPWRRRWHSPAIR